MDKIIQLSGGLVVTPLRRIVNSKGDLYHGLKVSEDSFKGFGEAYFSTVLPGATKGWKRHRLMTLNLIVPIGTIEFHVRSEDGIDVHNVRLGVDFYARLTVPPGFWVAFTGIGDNLNMLLNIASISHDPEEAVNAPLEQFPLPSPQQRSI